MGDLLNLVQIQDWGGIPVREDPYWGFQRVRDCMRQFAACTADSFVPLAPQSQRLVLAGRKQGNAQSCRAFHDRFLIGTGHRLTCQVLILTKNSLLAPGHRDFRADRQGRTHPAAGLMRRAARLPAARPSSERKGRLACPVTDRCLPGTGS